MAKAWTQQAVRDRLHPVVVGFVWNAPEVLLDHPPGTWDAVSDSFLGNKIRHRAAGHMLGWSRNASEFLGYARMCEELPSPEVAVSQRSRLPVSRPLCVTMGLSVAQWLDGRARNGDRAVGRDARDFLERAIDVMPPEAAAFAAAAILEYHEIPVADRGLVLDRVAAVLGGASVRP